MTTQEVKALEIFDKMLSQIPNGPESSQMDAAINCGHILCKEVIDALEDAKQIVGDGGDIYSLNQTIDWWIGVDIKLD
jgi:hypothetical protein